MGCTHQHVPRLIYARFHNNHQGAINHLHVPSTQILAALHMIYIQKESGAQVILAQVETGQRGVRRREGLRDGFAALGGDKVACDMNPQCRV